MNKHTPEDERSRALLLLERYATEPVSWQTLESQFRYCFFERPEGFVGFVDTGGAWVTAGSPVCAPDNIIQVAREFVATAKANARRAVFFGAESNLEESIDGKSFAVGLRPYWDPAAWTLEGHAQASFRYQLRRAQKHGVCVRRVDVSEIAPGTSLRSQIGRLVEDWQNRHAMAPMGFIVSLELYVFPEHHIYFAAERDGELVGLLSAVPIFRRNGWFVEDLLRNDHAPNGTNELMVNAFMELVREQGAIYVTLGLVPLAGPLSWQLKAVRGLTQPLFHFSGLEHFKEKLHPTGHEARYIVGSGGTSRLRNLIDVLTAFSRVGIVRFGLISLSRGPMVAVQGLTLLLVLWIPLLVVAPSATWFPSHGIHTAWCIFDVVLAVGLVSICRRYRHGLALVLTSAVTLDSLLTIYEVATFNLARVHGPLELLITIGACLGPILGAAVLWATWRRQRRRKEFGILRTYP